MPLMRADRCSLLSDSSRVASSHALSRTIASGRDARTIAALIAPEPVRSSAASASMCSRSAHPSTTSARSAVHRSAWSTTSPGAPCVSASPGSVASTCCAKTRPRVSERSELRAPAVRAASERANRARPSCRSVPATALSSVSSTVSSIAASASIRSSSRTHRSSAVATVPVTEARMPGWSSVSSTPEAARRYADTGMTPSRNAFANDEMTTARSSGSRSPTRATAVASEAGSSRIFA